MSTTTYSIENAKTGRSKCKKCKEPIGAGEIRLGSLAPGPNEMTFQTWVHPGCFTIPRKLASNGTTAETFVEELLEDNTKDSILGDEVEREKIIAQIAEKAKPKTKQEGVEDNPVKSRVLKIKQNAERLQEDAVKSEHDDDDRPSKRKKTEDAKGLTPEERKEVSIFLNYKFMNNDQLKDILRWNHGLVSGSKDILLVRIIDGEINGRFDRCAMCNGSRLKLNMEDGGRTVICGGQFDEETNLPIPCSFTCAAEEVPRRHPWYSTEPTEEEKEAMKAENEASKTDNVGGQEGTELLSNLQEKAKDLDWDLSSTAGLKKGAKDILQICTGHMDLPDDEGKARMKVGQLVAANRTRSAADILVLVADQFGFASVKAEKGKAKEQAMSNICKHHKNASIMSVMLELRDLYGKESNRNAAGSYGRVANAIKDLDYEITEDNAKGLGKGKSKVAGIGASTASKIYEFITTGTIEKLEEKRAALN